MSTTPETPKQERLENWLHAAFGAGASRETCLRGYLECFNRAEYYEAHDVLEHLWLGLERASPAGRFYKGLIQFAGGFVHLRLHRLEPGHRVHGRRLRPAAKLFALALANIESAMPGPHAEGIDVAQLRELMEQYAPAAAVGENRWTFETRPTLTWRL